MQIDRFLVPLVARLPGWVTPNRITVLRGLMLVPIVLVYPTHPLVAGWCFYVPAMLFDVVDGALARHRGISSENGALLDATVDKVLLHGLVWLSLLPHVGILLAVLLAGLDLALTGIRPLKRWRGRSLEANVFGKAKTIVMAFGVGWIVSDVPIWMSGGIVLLWVTVGLAVLSLVAHIGDFFGKRDAS